MENGENIHQVLSIGVCWKSNDANQAKGWCFVFFFFFFFFSFLMKYTHTHTYIFRIYISLNIQLFCRVLCVKVVIYRKKWWRVIAIWHEHFVSLTMGRGRVRGRVKWTAPPLHVDFMLLIFSMGNRLSRRTLTPPPLLPPFAALWILVRIPHFKSDMVQSKYHCCLSCCSVGDAVIERNTTGKTA